MRLLLAFVAGSLFGLGLTISRMMDPAKVLGFLDVAGSWDPSLLLVLGGATGTTLVCYRLIFRRPEPMLTASFELPTEKRIEQRVIVGAAVFGSGWALVGCCPGPALAALTVAPSQAGVFVISMCAGTFLARYVPNQRKCNVD